MIKAPKGASIKIIYALFRMLKRIHDRFGQNQVQCRKKPKFSSHHHQNLSHSEKQYRPYALLGDKCQPENQETASNYVSMS